MRGVEEEGSYENISAWPNKLSALVTGVISDGGPGPAKNKGKYTSSRMEQEEDAQNRPSGEAVEMREPQHKRGTFPRVSVKESPFHREYNS